MNEFKKDKNIEQISCLIRKLMVIVKQPSSYIFERVEKIQSFSYR